MARTLAVARGVAVRVEVAAAAAAALGLGPGPLLVLPASARGSAREHVAVALADLDAGGDAAFGPRSTATGTSSRSPRRGPELLDRQPVRGRPRARRRDRPPAPRARARARRDAAAFLADPLTPGRARGAQRR